MRGTWPPDIKVTGNDLYITERKPPEPTVGLSYKSGLEYRLGDVPAGCVEPPAPAAKPDAQPAFRERKKEGGEVTEVQAKYGTVTLPPEMDVLCEDLRRDILERAAAIDDLESHHATCELRRAQILIDEGIVNGKNEAQRAAQLTLALACDSDYQEALRKESQLKRYVALADASLECNRSKVRLLEAWLRSQAR